MGQWLGGWLYKHENITNTGLNSVQVGSDRAQKGSKLPQKAKNQEVGKQKILQNES